MKKFLEMYTLPRLKQNKEVENINRTIVGNKTESAI